MGWEVGWVGGAGGGVRVRVGDGGVLEGDELRSFHAEFLEY